MTEQEKIEILKADGYTTNEAKKSLYKGTSIFEQDDFESNINSYLSEWGITDIEDKQTFYDMIETKFPYVDGWSVIEYKGQVYYIEYSL